MWLGFKCKKVRRKLWLWIYIWTRKGETDVHYSLLSVSWSKLPIGTDYKVRTLYSNCLLQWFVCVLCLRAQWHFFLNFKSCFYCKCPTRYLLDNLFPFQDGEILENWWGLSSTSCIFEQWSLLCLFYWWQCFSCWVNRFFLGFLSDNLRWLLVKAASIYC